MAQSFGLRLSYPAVVLLYAAIVLSISYTGSGLRMAPSPRTLTQTQTQTHALAGTSIAVSPHSSRSRAIGSHTALLSSRNGVGAPNDDGKLGGGVKQPFSFGKEDIASLKSLLKEIATIVLQTNIKTSFKRSFQIANAIARFTRDAIETPENFRSSTGSIAPEKVLRKLFEELGATYVKLGQFIASSPTLFPAEYVREFQSCLDNAPSIPYQNIQRIIQSELKRPIADVFSYINPVPLATASIAQVHRAKLRATGEEVVIKVRKPGVDSTLEVDLNFLLVAAKIAEFISPSLSRLSTANIVEDIRDSMLDELDFRKEAANLNNFRSYLEKNGILEAVAPKPYPDCSTDRILVMEYLKGVPLVDLEGVRRFSPNPELTLFTALKTWGSTVTENDRFHADLHGGNLLVLEDGRVGFIDFGIVGRLKPTTLSALSDLVASLVSDDYKGVASALVRIGATNSKVDIEKFARDIQEVAQKIANLQPTIVVEQSGDAVSAAISLDDRETTDLVLEIVSVADKNGLKLPREFGLLLKQSLYFDRYQKLLAPSVDILRDSRVRTAFMAETGVPQPPTSSRPTQKRTVIDMDPKDVQGL